MHTSNRGNSQRRTKNFSHNFNPTIDFILQSKLCPSVMKIKEKKKYINA